LASVGVTVDLVNGEPAEEVAWKEGGGVIFQTHALADHEFVTLSIRGGPGEGLDDFRSAHSDWRLSAPKTTQVCGKAATMQRATRPAQEIVCVITATGNHPDWIAPSLVVEVVFKHRGVPVRARFEAESTHLGELEAARAHFFQSIRCR
jgi:hypothetical protein